MKKLSIFICLVFFLMFSLWQNNIWAQNNQISSISQNKQLSREEKIRQAIAKRVILVSSVTRVREGWSVDGGGTGIIMKKEDKKDGSLVLWILTAIHVVSNWEPVLTHSSTKISIINNDRTYATDIQKIVAFDWGLDALVLQVVIPPNRKKFFDKEPMEIADFAPQEGEDALTAGFASVPVFGITDLIINYTKVNKIKYIPKPFRAGPGQENTTKIKWQMLLKLNEGYSGPGLSGGPVFRVIDDSEEIKLELLGIIFADFKGGFTYCVPIDVPIEVIKREDPRLLNRSIWTLKKFLFNTITNLK